MSLRHITQFAVVEAGTLKPVMRIHQDDQEDPLVADTLEGLIGMWADFNDVAESTLYDVAESTLFEALDEDGELDPADVGDDGERCKIVRQEIEVWDLTPDELAELQRLRDAD